MKLVCVCGVLTCLRGCVPVCMKLVSLSTLFFETGSLSVPELVILACLASQAPWESRLCFPVLEEQVAPVPANFYVGLAYLNSCFYTMCQVFYP